MPPRLGQRLVDRLLPEPELAGAEDVALILRRGGPSLRIRALGGGGQPGGATSADQLVSLLSDPVPGVRRRAGWALGRRGEGRALDPVWQAARRERMDTVRLALAVAAVRLGAEVRRAWELLDDAARRQLASYYGPRGVARVTGAGPDLVARRWFRTLAPAADHHGDPAALRPVPAVEARQAALDRIHADPEDREALLELAAQQDPADHERIVARKWVSGRRESHVICEALGEHGDPRGIPTLVQVLRAMDVDPGHGFAGRRAASVALGRVGDPSVRRVLEKALVDEALDHEGRPGAGLGIQFPVRMVILTALGEAGCRDSAEVLASYLANVSGSAMGGFYLPAMDALWKLDRPAPVEALLGGDELPAANAVGVLAAMGRHDLVRRCLQDPRSRVAAAAADGLREG